MRNLLKKIRYQFATKNFFNSNQIYSIHYNRPNLTKCLTKPNVDCRQRKKIQTEHTIIRKFAEMELKELDILNKNFKTLSIKPLHNNEILSVSSQNQSYLNEEQFLKNEWMNFLKSKQQDQMEQLERALKSQHEALEELKMDNLVLYNAAIQV
ncbi:hypothetical protein BpHYR1_034962 [Brachionus plicatilis]|uniref:Uncharacterized protein n=1 Tax=Brachionus plicatilis TaxID=10195 RepID=A0A3M7S3V6_BRAPC|nr:hypothetical protein BpHYR1_034962 [Brachionus plicatilis]